MLWERLEGGGIKSQLSCANFTFQDVVGNVGGMEGLKGRLEKLKEGLERLKVGMEGLKGRAGGVKGG